MCLVQSCQEGDTAHPQQSHLELPSARASHLVSLMSHTPLQVPQLDSLKSAAKAHIIIIIFVKTTG